MTPLRSNLEQKLGWIILAIVLGGCLLVLLPFASALLWAVILTFSSWPLYRRLVNLLRGRRTLAALLITFAMFCVILLPFVVVGATLKDNVKDLTTATRRWMDEGPPAPPDWVAKLPAVGPKVAEYWRNLAADSTPLIAAGKKLIEPVSGWLLVGGLALGHGLIELALSILIAFFLFRDGITAAQRLSTAIEWIAQEQGKRLLKVAGDTVRGVVYGILGTAFIQAIMAEHFGYLDRGRAGGCFSRNADVLPLGRTRRPSSDLVAGRSLVISSRLHRMGNLHADLGRGGKQRRQFRQAVAHQSGQRHALPVDLLWRPGVGRWQRSDSSGVFIGPTLLAVGYCRLVQEWASTHYTSAANESPAISDSRLA